MHRLTLRCVIAGVMLAGTLGAQTIRAVAVEQVATQPAPSSSQPAAPAQPRTKRAAASTRQAARLGLDIEVTDAKGTPISDVAVNVAGPVEREGATGTQGDLKLANLRAGTYRLRFTHDKYVTLERELTLGAGGREEPVSVMLSDAPSPTAVAAPPPATPSSSEPTTRPIGEPRTVQVPEFTETNFIGRNEPQKISVLGCTGYSMTRLLQVRDPLDGRTNTDADETLYVVAGEAMLKLAGVDRPLAPGALAVIPRGMSHSIARKGRNPAIFVSVLSGPPCQP